MRSLFPAQTTKASVTSERNELPSGVSHAKGTLHIKAQQPQTSH